MIVVQFEPYGFHLLTGLPMKEHKNHFFELDDFFSSSVLQTLYQQLFSAREDVSKVKIIEAFILAQMKKRDVERRVLFAAQQIHSNPQLKLDELVSYLNVSARRLRALFALNIGISPKYFLRLSRFNQTAREVATNQTKSLTEIACDYGYFDQAHFIREFREFGQLSPKRFRAMAEKSAEFYNSE